MTETMVERFRATSAVTRGAGRRLAELQRIEGFAFDAELCVNAARLELRVAEVLVVWSHAGESHVRLVLSSVSMGRDLCRIAWHARTRPR